MLASPRLGRRATCARPSPSRSTRFGPDRLVCGSDWPVALLNGDYEQVWRETVRVVEDVAPAEAEQLLSGTALRLYDLERVPAATLGGGA